MDRQATAGDEERFATSTSPIVPDKVHARRLEATRRQEAIGYVTVE
jgi:hypothetical protein